MRYPSALLLPLALLLFAVPAFSQITAWTGRVVAVADGDTITVLAPGNRQQRIRLAGIDAPENGQDFGQKAKRHLSSLVHGGHVTVVSKKMDRYGRVVAQVFLSGKDVGLQLIESGVAWHIREFALEQTAADARGTVMPRRLHGRRN